MSNFSSWNSPSDPPNAGSLPLLGPAPVFRNAKDARLAAFGASPDAQYPDGYLGTITNRRQDKIQSAVVRQNQRQYTRGVHKGERINPGDYVWPKEFNLYTGIELLSEGKKYAPTGGITPQLTNDGKTGPRGIPSGLTRPMKPTIDKARQANLKSLAPAWR